MFLVLLLILRNLKIIPAIIQALQFCLLHNPPLYGILMQFHLNFLNWVQEDGMRWRALFIIPDLYPAATRYPDYYNGKLFIYDWIRGWIKVVTLQPNGDFEQMESFMPHTVFT